MAEQAHILVVDDDASIRRMLQLLLNETGYRVSTASTGEEALAYMDLVTPDLVLMDLMLPGINGQEVTERIKAQPDKPFVPVILVTARNDPKSKVMALDAGADDFLVKPVEFAELLARVRAMLRLQRSQRSLRAEQRKTELLLHLTRELGTTLDLEELLTHFLDKLADAVGAVRASIILTTDQQPRLFSSIRNRPKVVPADILRDGIAGWVLREHEPAIILDTRDDTRWVATTAHQQMVRSVAAVPIVREDRVLGVITLVHHTPGYFTPEHLSLLDSVAAQSAIALENAELFRLTRTQNDLLERRNEELQRINQVSRLLTELMRPEQLVRLVAYLVHLTFGYPSVTILLRDNDDLVVRAVAGIADEESRMGRRLPIGQGIAGHAAMQQEPLCVADIRADARSSVSISGDDTRSQLAVPILTAREVFGVLNVESASSGAFGPNDIRLLDTLSGQLGVALENAQLFDTEQRRVRQLGHVNSMSVAITAQLDASANLRIAAAAVAAIFGIEQCGIVMLGDERRGGLRVVTHSAQPASSGAQLRFPLPLHDLAALDIRTVQVIGAGTHDEQLAPVRELLAHGHIDTLVLAPLLNAGRRIGTLVLDLTGRARQFGQAEQTLLETVTSLLAQVLENARLYREVAEERSTLDAVLGGAADPILLIGTDDRLLLANRAAHERLGIQDHAEQQPIDRLIGQSDLLHALSGQRNGHGPHPLNEVVLPQGETFSISVAPVRGADDELIGRVTVLQDITAIKELERREQERLRSVFRRYVSPQVVEEVLAGGGDIGAPVERDLVVIFADIRGYTALTEGLPPRVLVEQVLNRYFTAMTDALHRHGGTIDKFLGDGLIGVFGSPIVRDDDVQRALLAAVDLQRAFAELRSRWRSELRRDIGMGIGIAYGRAVVGNIGSEQRMDYTLIGDVVNTASRLNGIAHAGQIIATGQLIDALPPHWHAPWPIRKSEPVHLKGKQEPVPIYEIEYEAKENAH
ncbi:MAG TPA: GAF domain-containing protein [Kouleothrix sp.]|uniref:GAF domain-containing protein n=1 Tax=Kouleothrix sp. TaxID=2779161 RepID=UPI002CC3C0FB|nr:GAF domain-containing protein [Kouleothrix sp.]HRC74703.1 GAF domain-containing protein [Kouleothrix sp.]